MVQFADIGAMPDRLVLFGGPYSNLQALQALVDRESDSLAICTGDSVAYCGRPEETVQLLRETGWAVLAGNCERQIAAGSDECGCGFEDGSACDRLSSAWYPFARDAVSAETRAWMKDLPDALVFTQGALRFVALHGGATDIARYLWPSDAEETFAEEIARIEAQIGRVDGVVAGHCGLAFDRQIGRHRWINAGVIGMPPHDGRTETRYATLENGETTFRRLAYDAKGAASDMADAGLPDGYREALLTGIWPSEDVLPMPLRR